MPRGVVVTDKQRARMWKLSKSGFNSVDIGHTLHLSGECVSSQLNKLEESKGPLKGRQRNKYGAYEDLSMFLNYIKEGHTIDLISEFSGYSKSTIYRVLARHKACKKFVKRNKYKVRK